MALHQRAFDILTSLAPCRLLSLGVPDILVNKHYHLPEVSNADTLRQMHGWTGPIYETDLVFKQHRIEATYLDTKQWTGKEVVADLNEPLGDQGIWQWDKEKNQFNPQATYDVVLDPGTLEHCFNIGQAFVNVRNLCKPGGHIIHTNPMNLPNHGFYSLSPVAYSDWYEHHGDTMLNITALSTNGEQNYAVQARRRFNFPIPAWTLIVVKRGPEATLCRGYPKQYKYLDQDERDERKARSSTHLPLQSV